MPKTREKEIWEIGEVPYDKSEAGDKARQLAKDDFKFFLKHIWFSTNQDYQSRLGKIHDLLIDFMRLHELPDISTEYVHSELRRYLPARNSRREYAERWIYWRNWGEAPDIQDGPEGPISKLFHEGEWAGIIVRVVGDAHDKAVLIPRGHIKSTLCSEAHTAWEIIREPYLRHIILSQKRDLATKCLGSIKSQFSGNPAFMRLFQHLGAPKKNEALPWSNTLMQVRTQERRGQEPTVSSYSVGTEVTGVHADHVKCDDVVGQKNVGTIEQRQKVREKIKNLDAVRDPGSFFTDIGTIWSYDDAHREYIRPDGHSYSMTSFIVATVRMEDGSPLWPEKFTDQVIKRLEKKYAGDIYFFKCQYYNQPNAGSARTFKPEWRKYWDAPSAEALVVDRKLDIYVTCDPASSEHKKSDYSACLVHGQASTGERYLLDGFREHLGPDDLPQALAEILIHWQGVAHRAGVSFRFGLETAGFQNYIKKPLENALRDRGHSVGIEDLKHKYRSKPDRIKVLCHPYAMGLYYWPRTLKRYAIGKEDKDGGREEYDLVAAMNEEFLRFSPKSTSEKDDLMDTQAYAETMMMPVDMKAEVKEEKAKLQYKAYSREEVLQEMQQERAFARPQGHDSYTRHRGMPFGGMRGWR